MKKNILILFLIMNITMIYSQSPVEDDHLRVKAFYGEKVIVNKKVVSYTITGKTTYSNINIPFNIFITSNDLSGTIRINSKKLREDIMLRFNCIHKKMTYLGLMYSFYDDDGEVASYTIPKDGSHQELYMSFKDGSSYLFTISKYDQL
mgnify:CR=1 FL=1